MKGKAVFSHVSRCCSACVFTLTLRPSHASYTRSRLRTTYRGCSVCGGREWREICARIRQTVKDACSNTQCFGRGKRVMMEKQWVKKYFNVARRSIQNVIYGARMHLANNSPPMILTSKVCVHNATHTHVTQLWVLRGVHCQQLIPLVEHRPESARWPCRSRKFPFFLSSSVRGAKDAGDSRGVKERLRHAKHSCQLRSVR